MMQRPFAVGRTARGDGFGDSILSKDMDDQLGKTIIATADVTNEADNLERSSTDGTILE